MLADLIARLEAATAETQSNDLLWVVDALKLPAREHFRIIRLILSGAFLDAALTLVPEGADEEVYFSPREKPHRRGCAVLTISRQVYAAHAATPALAMCIAALKARAADGGPR